MGGGNDCLYMYYCENSSIYGEMHTAVCDSDFFSLNFILSIISERLRGSQMV